MTKSDGAGPAEPRHIDLTQPQAQPDDGSVQPGGGTQQVMQRPITDFLTSQGTYCFDDGFGGCRTFVSPVPNSFAWFDRGQNLGISVDYTGMTNSWLESVSGNQRSLGTQVNGTISEQLREDGRSLVLVDLHTTNAASFAIRGPQWGVAPAAMGYEPSELKDDQSKPALGTAHLHLAFINDAFGGRLPDLNQLLVAPRKGQELVDFRFDYDGHGTMRENEGLPVHIWVAQDSPMMMAFPGDPSLAPMGTARIDLIPE